MTLKERILEELRKNGRRALPELAEMLKAPKTTVRHDLLQLAAEGKVRRIPLSPRIILWESIKKQE